MQYGLLARRRGRSSDHVGVVTSRDVRGASRPKRVIAPVRPIQPPEIVINVSISKELVDVVIARQFDYITLWGEKHLAVSGELSVAGTDEIKRRDS